MTLSVIWAAITSRVGKFVAGALLAASILAASFAYGRKSANSDHRIDDLEDYKRTRETIDEVNRSPDADAAFERLRRNGWLR